MQTPSFIFSVDVEDWFHSENLPVTYHDWPNLESRVTRNTEKLLSILDKYQIKGTFFILGWVAQRERNLVLEIKARGHEIACHGFNHQLVYRLSESEFKDDTKKAKDLLEDITGGKILGYRASNFSITDRAIDILRELGFGYDSSLCPVFYHDRYGKLNNYQIDPNADVIQLHPGFWEVTIPVWQIGKYSLPWGGGGYFRLLPYPLYKIGIKSIVKKRPSFLFYIHPREIDPGQPYFAQIPWMGRFRHYVGLKQAETRLNHLCKDYKFQPIKEKLGIMQV
ncbi:MAG: polysaccharide deacetylase family protein [Candidatus Schekmanbacteria bacterium]|nr:polysaccharide deacetylase family protein [Candidatus Schekmanbacteria bacterium]